MRRTGIIAVLLLAAFAGGTAFFITRSADAPQTGGAVTATGTTSLDQPAAAVASGSGTKQDALANGPQQRADQVPAAPPPAPPAALPPAPDGDVTGLVALEGTLTATASASGGSITCAFYVRGPAYFTIQLQSGSSWQTVRENVYYPGNGGLEAGQLTPADNAMTLRLLQAAPGGYIAASAPVTVTRDDVSAAGGIRSYKLG